MTAGVKDGLSGPIKSLEAMMRPQQTRATVAPVNPDSSFGRFVRTSHQMRQHSDMAAARNYASGAFNLRRTASGMRRAGHEHSPAGSFTLPDPDIIPHGYGQNTRAVNVSYMMRPASLRPNFTASGAATGRTSRELAQQSGVGGNKERIEDSLMNTSPSVSRYGRRPSRMSHGVQRSLVPQTSPRDTHRAAAASARIDSYNPPAGFHNVHPTGMSPAGVPTPADPHRANLRRLPNAVHTTPIAAVRGAHAAGVSPEAAARGDGRGVDGKPLQPHMDSHGFLFMHRSRTDFRTPNFYPARDAQSDVYLFENAAKYAPDFRADLSDRMAASMVNRFPEPLQSREGLMREYLKDFVSSKDRYMRPRQGPSVSK